MISFKKNFLRRLPGRDWKSHRASGSEKGCSAKATRDGGGPTDRAAEGNDGPVALSGSLVERSSGLVPFPDTPYVSSFHDSVFRPRRGRKI